MFNKIKMTIFINFEFEWILQTGEKPNDYSLTFPETLYFLALRIFSLLLRQYFQESDTE